MPFQSSRPRVCAVSYLNTVPLVWGLLKDPAQAGTFDLRFAVPSVCADQLASGEADIGIVPVIEMARQKLAYFRETGIASYGPVRSILLISKVPFGKIRKLATDSGSRTSVMLSRIILAEKYGVEPQVISHPPDLAAMLGAADAALLIGDAALRVDPATLPFETLDLGEAVDQPHRSPHGVRRLGGPRRSDRRAVRRRARGLLPLRACSHRRHRARRDHATAVSRSPWSANT